MGEIAKYVTGAVQSGITTELGNINAVLTEKYGVSTTLATFVGNVYDKLFSDDAKAQQAQLNELLTAINAYVAKQKAQIMQTMQLLSNRLLTHRSCCCSQYAGRDCHIG